MKKIAYMLSMALMVVMLNSCIDNNRNNSSSTDNYVNTDNSAEKVQDEPEEQVREAEKKPLKFYQKLLEQFCQNYYNSCFDGREYHSNSLIADHIDVVQGNWKDGNIVSWEMMIKGKHSFKGSFKNHNDSPFEAFVNDLGDDNYEVTFVIKRYDILGDQMDEDEIATRTITFTE